MNSPFLYYSDVFMEKHWKSVIHKSICDYFFEAQGKVCTNEFVSMFQMNVPGH